MAKLTRVRACDGFWEATSYLGLHRLGSPQPGTPLAGKWADQADELLLSGLTVRQILLLTELIELTVERTKERHELPDRPSHE